MSKTFPLAYKRITNSEEKIVKDDYKKDWQQGKDKGTHEELLS